MEKQKDSKPRIHIGTIGHVDGSRDTLSAAIDRYLSSQKKDAQWNAAGDRRQNHS